jgi:hypothetical protein
VIATGHKTKKNVTCHKPAECDEAWSRAGVAGRGKTFFLNFFGGRQQVVTVEVDPSEGKEKHFIKPTLSSNFTVLDIDIARRRTSVTPLHVSHPICV